jgi:hypothetical protein
MNLNRVAAVLLTGTIAVAAAGTGVAIGSSTSAGVKACSTNSGHKLGLIKNGKCAKGSTKVTLGAQGLRGKTGPQGPGAIEQEMTVPGDDVQHTFSKNVAGIVVHASCTLAGNPTFDLEPALSGQLLDMYGTYSRNVGINVVELPQVHSFTFGTQPEPADPVTTYAAVDLTARAGTAPFADLKIVAVKSSTECLLSEVAVPTKAAS